VRAVESLKSRGSLILLGAISFVVVIAGMRFAGGDPLLQPQADIGIVAGVALVILFLVLNDTRGEAKQ
jgi:hypothetical protein